jgi:hypothetical protein
MPTRKQRRRRDKTFRHEYDFVTYDEEGNEVAVDPQELRKEKEPAKPKPQAQAKGGRAVREVPPPSWKRAVKRGGLMGLGLIVLTSFLMKGKGGGIVIGVFYALALIPFTYWIDRFAYRNYLRKTGKQV